MILSAIAFCLALSPSPARDITPAKAGDPFPTVALKAANATAVEGKSATDSISVADFKGKTVVYFFYPKANTPGCTTESCGFRDLAPKFPANAVLVGVSSDTVAAQEKFAKDHKLPFVLLADPKMELINALGVKSDRGPVAKRVTIVVGPDGKIAKLYPTVKPADHPAEVLEFVETLK